ncbi:MAG: Obg family GTPase CgtA, partial [Lachnospiraceae bacterium]|nr:Obg family GTPase CgtA [Lachnospiraceae bacterium]
IEGASEGVGLGHEFLRHVERTKVLIHIVDAAGSEGRNPVEDVYAINRELEYYNPQLPTRPQVIAANKLDLLEEAAAAEAVEKLKAEFEPQGYQVIPISAATGQGVRELLYKVLDMLSKLDDKPVVFAQEYFPEQERNVSDEPFTISYDSKEEAYVVEGPSIERMLGYTNLDSEKGFQFFQNFLKEKGILAKLEEMGIQDGDTVKVVDLSFDYYKN